MVGFELGTFLFLELRLREHTAQIYDETTTLLHQKYCTVDFSTTFCSIRQIVVVFRVSKIFSKSIFQGELSL